MDKVMLHNIGRNQSCLSMTTNTNNNAVLDNHVLLSNDVHQLDLSLVTNKMNELFIDLLSKTLANIPNPKSNEIPLLALKDLSHKGALIWKQIPKNDKQIFSSIHQFCLTILSPPLKITSDECVIGQLVYQVNNKTKIYVTPKYCTSYKT